MQLLWSITATVAMLGLVAELAHYLRPSLQTVLIPLFSLSIEGNFPTWYAASLLLCCGLLLLLIAASVRQTGAGFARRWQFLGCVFLFMSLDEAIEIHENPDAQPLKIDSEIAIQPSPVLADPLLN